MESVSRGTVWSAGTKIPFGIEMSDNAMEMEAFPFLGPAEFGESPIFCEIRPYGQKLNI